MIYLFANGVAISSCVGPKIYLEEFNFLDISLAPLASKREDIFSNLSVISQLSTGWSEDIRISPPHLLICSLVRFSMFFKTSHPSRVYVYTPDNSGLIKPALINSCAFNDSCSLLTSWYVFIPLENSFRNWILSVLASFMFTYLILSIAIIFST